MRAPRGVVAGTVLGVWWMAHVAVQRVLVPGDPLPWWTLAAAFAIPVVAIPLWLAIERALGVDQEAVASAVRWCACVLASPKSIAVMLAVAVLLIVPSFFGGLWFLALPAVVFLAIVPLGIASRSVVTSATGEGWWKPPWPGLAPFTTVAVLVFAFTAVERAVAHVSGRVPLLLAVEVAFAVAWVALAAVVLLFGATLPQAVAMLRRAAAPIVAVHARLAYVVLVLVAPILAGSIYAWTVVPTQAVRAEAAGTTLPWMTRAVVTSVNLLDGTGLLAVAFVLGVMLWLLVGRMLVTCTTTDTPR